MAESNATQVILTDDGIKIINAQNTADNAASDVDDLNDPNLMSVIEKQTVVSQYAGLTSQYNVVLARAKEASISTTDLTTAYANLDTFMSAILTDTTKASDVDRDTYKSLTDAYNTALSNVQTALSDSFNTDIDNMQSSVSVASQAASSATIVASQATVTGNNASQVASQAITAASQAQDTGDNATSVANNASQAASSAILAGSTATVNADKALTAASQAQDTGNNATSVANNASQAASSAVLAGSTAAVSASQASADYQTLSAGVKDGSVVHITTETVIDKGVIGTAEIANGAITNAQIGNEAVGTAQIADLAVGTAQIGDGAITNAKIGSLAVGTAQIANGAITNAQIGSLAVDTTNIKDAAVNSAKIADLAVGTAQIGDGAITNAKIGSLAVGTAQIADAAITDAQVGNVSANKLTAGTIDFNTITGENINASNITTGTLSTDRLKVDKLSALSANLGDVTTGSLKGVDIVANTFSTPNGSFTTDSNGAITANNMALIGGTLSSPTINASTINGSTINGTTFHGGDIISNSNNTSNFYPFTIESSGKTSTTLFNSMDALRTEMSGGGIRIMYRAINSSGTTYEAYDGNFDGNVISLNSGFTNGNDMSFSQSVSGDQLTGQVILSPLDGIHLWGSTQSIHFSGLQTDGTGITFNSYGNIIADQASTWWRITNFSGSDIANFGTDTAGSNVIQFNRELDIGNFQINTGHTFTSADNGAFHFAMGKGGAADIYAGAVNYTSLVKSSLLSVKRDVQKADTAYWAQLVNSIDLATYQYKSDDNTSQIRLSSIVDDVNDTKQWRLPDVFINRDEDGKLSGVDDSVLLNATLATVQEQQKEIDQLNGHNMELEARLDKLEAKLNG
ncbi:phage tail protein [Lactiplantibacillus plantarum]|uniref:phage tail protein n=1 Tax=Lactiplantibacillus plantarum TaxID=1590 RepID=UPI001F4D2135|nr:phage tail protein [Lactiplantibacillus plantarum]MCH8629849.1 phage tail protein [Lactiplantibacillus plantarum]MCH8632517.1 phage tail protein [Lactiplantibacillus plantarum]